MSDYLMAWDWRQYPSLGEEQAKPEAIPSTTRAVDLSRTPLGFVLQDTPDRGVVDRPRGHRSQHRVNNQEPVRSLSATLVITRSISERGRHTAGSGLEDIGWNNRSKGPFEWLADVTDNN
jgi:hypothetical protein